MPHLTLLLTACLGLSLGSPDSLVQQLLDDAHARRDYRLAARLARGLPVDVSLGSNLPFPVGERINFDASVQLPFVGAVKVGSALMQVQPTRVEGGEANLHITAEITIDKYQPCRIRQEIFVDPESLLVSRTENTRFDGSNQLTEQYTDTFDHAAHRTERVRPGSAPVTTQYASGAMVMVHSWIPYYLRAKGFDLGTTWSIGLVDDPGPFELRVTDKTTLEGANVYALKTQPERLSAWLFADTGRLPRRVVMDVAALALEDRAMRTIILDYKSVERPFTGGH